MRSLKLVFAWKKRLTQKRNVKWSLTLNAIEGMNGVCATKSNFMLMLANKWIQKKITKNIFYKYKIVQ